MVTDWPTQALVLTGCEVMLAGGFTVTVIVIGVPTQPPVIAVGVTMYWTVPGAVLVFVSVCAIALPVAAAAPVMLPVTVPTVQLKLLAMSAVKGIFVVAPLQIGPGATAAATGLEFTTNVKVEVVLRHALALRTLSVPVYVPGVMFAGIGKVRFPACAPGAEMAAPLTGCNPLAGAAQVML
jgi:hypothetical protein